MPAHLKEGIKKRPEGTSEVDMNGNDKADELAGIAADFLKVPYHVCSKHIKYVNSVKNQKRLATILLYFPSREKVRQEKTNLVKDSIHEILGKTKHNISTKSDRYHCSTCLKYFAMKDPAAKHWLLTSCTPIVQIEAPMIHKPISILVYEPIHIGNQHMFRMNSGNSEEYCIVGNVTHMVYTSSPN